jgi:hypothetical protein
MDIRNYIARVERSYDYKIKTVCPLDDDAMGRVESVMVKYHPLKLGEPRKLMWQKAPLDFRNIEAAEIHVVEVSTLLPASGYVLTKELQIALGVPEGFVVVRGANDPTEIEDQVMATRAEMDEEAEKKGEQKGAVLDAPHYEDAAEIPGSAFYGDAYNRRLMGYLKKVEDERRPQPIDAPNAPFKWLDVQGKDLPPQDPGPTLGREDGPVGGEGDHKIAPMGNVQDVARSYTRLYQKAGKTFVKATNLGSKK